MKRIWSLALALGFLQLGCGLSTGGPSWPETFGYRAKELHEIEIGDFGFPYIPVEISGTPLMLPFDTGNMVGLSVSSEQFDRLGLSSDRVWESLDAAGESRGKLRGDDDVEARVLGRRLGSVPVYEIDHPRLPGLVGPDSLPGDHFTLDYRSRVLGVGEGSLPKTIPGFRRLELVRSPRHPRLILVRATVEGLNVLCELDTGKSRTVVNPGLASRLGLERNSRGVAIDHLVLGDLALEVPSAKLVDQTGIETGRPERILLGIGSDLLSQFVWSVDYEAGRLWLPAAG